MIDHFGFLAPVYETFIKSKHPDILSDLLQMPPSGSLLDLGGGTGRVSQYFTDSNAQVTVCDLSFPMLEQSLKKEGLRQVCSHSEELPFPSKIFDRIIMVDALHHVHDQQRTAQEMWRVLKPGGRIVIEEPNHHHPLVKIVAWVEKIALMRSHFLKPQEIQALFSSNNGFLRQQNEGYTVWITIQKPERSMKARSPWPDGGQLSAG